MGTRGGPRPIVGPVFTGALLDSRALLMGGTMRLGTTVSDQSRGQIGQPQFFPFAGGPGSRERTRSLFLVIPREISFS